MRSGDQLTQKIQTMNKISTDTVLSDEPETSHFVNARLCARELKKNDCLQTPKWVYEALGEFDLDPCAGLDTTIAKTNWCIERGEDGLLRKWFGFWWTNCPFSQKEDWIDKAFEWPNGIMVLPERGSAPWFGPLVSRLGKYFVMGKKINYIGGPSSNNLGSVLLPFGEEAEKRIKGSGLPGHWVTVEWFQPRCA